MSNHEREIARRRGWRILAAAAALLIALTVAAKAVADGEARAALAQAPLENAPTPQIGVATLDGYALSLAKAWEKYTLEDGAVLDPLIPADSAVTTDASARFMIIMMAEAMLRLSQRDTVPSLAETATRILSETASLPALNDPFNLLALASLISDGERGEFPASAWQKLAGPIETLAEQIRFPAADEQKCFFGVGCYSNWRLVWAAGASILLDDHLPDDGTSGTLVSEPSRVLAEIDADLKMALTAAGKPTTTSTGVSIRELSDPGEEPAAYHIFSIWMLNAVLQADPAAVTPQIEQLRQQADDYALAMMAPDGQLSLSGRSLDQSWVQAAAASLGGELARTSQDDIWDTFANQALGYLLNDYPTMPDGTLATVPGLALDWNPEIVDSYAEYNQYNGLTLWFLVNALSNWPAVQAAAPPAPQAASAEEGSDVLPADGSLLVDDLASSGLVWGRSRDVWWMISGRTTAPDRRSEQGLVSVKVYSSGQWQDVLALRPLALNLTSAWRMTFEHKEVTPVFTSVTGTGASAELHGYFPLGAHFDMPVTWRLTTISDGIEVTMHLKPLSPQALERHRRSVGRHHQSTRPPRTARLGKYGLSASLWTTSLRQSIPSNSWGAAYYPCLVSASGHACPIALYWRLSRAASSYASVTIAL